jgi:hypothetical protein
MFFGMRLPALQPESSANENANTKLNFNISCQQKYQYETNIGVLVDM